MNPEHPPDKTLAQAARGLREARLELVLKSAKAAGLVRVIDWLTVKLNQVTNYMTGP